VATKPTTIAPRLDPITLTDLDDGRADQLHRGADLDGVRFAGVTVTSIDLTEATVLGCSFDVLSADDASLDGTRLIETHVGRLTVPVLRGRRGTWRDVHVEESRVGSAELYEVTWQSVHVVGCRLGFVNLRAADLRDVVFTRCTVDELDLVQASAQRVVFRDTTIGRLDVQGAQLQHVDLRGAELADLAGIQSLGGVTVSPAQLELLSPLLARELGITVEEPTDR
jgi:uncharacterized protein YjbI with pentapeptide repeats